MIGSNVATLFPLTALMFVFVCFVVWVWCRFARTDRRSCGAPHGPRTFNKYHLSSLWMHTRRAIGFLFFAVPRTSVYLCARKREAQLLIAAHATYPSHKISNAKYALQDSNRGRKSVKEPCHLDSKAHQMLGKHMPH